MFILFFLIPLLIFSRYHWGGEVPHIDALFPTTTAVLLVLHALISFFMFMQYRADRKKLYLAILSLSYLLSAIYLICKVFYSPGVFKQAAVIHGTVNDLGVYWVFRSITMSVIFILMMLVYLRRDAIEWNHRKTIVVVSAIGVITFVFAFLLSSGYEHINLYVISDDGLNYSKLWGSGIGYAVGALWLAATVMVFVITKLKNVFWLAIGVSCISYLGCISLMHGSTYINSVAWNYSRFFEVLSTFLVLMILLYDIFSVYTKTLTKYKVSYESSIRDPLTNLYNRRYYYDAMKNNLEKHKDSNVKLAVMVADIDFFKRFNDTYGHVQGDEVIKYVAYTLSRSIRHDDVPSRIGGEEFSALIVGADENEVYSLAERFRNNVKSADTSGFPGEIPAPVTISVGVYFIEADDRSVENCIEKADKAMYQAKQSGRDRVVIYKDVIP